MESLLLRLLAMRLQRRVSNGALAPFGSVHLPLRRLALCLDCDECFELGYASCPACGSGTWSPLGRFLDIAAGARPARTSSNGNGTARRVQPKRAAEELAIAKHLLVVARHRRELYDEIKRA